jgi:hypothetical protein
MVARAHSTAFHNRYLQDPQSVVSNLAFPEVQFIRGDGYISVRECIANLLAHGRPVNAFNSGMKLPSEAVGYNKTVRTTSESLRLRNMMIRAQVKYPNDHVLCLPIYGWGDDYDPYASIKGEGVLSLQVCCNIPTTWESKQP